MNDNNIRRILIMGPPGSGKGTQAQLLGKLLCIPVFIIRDIIKEALDLIDEVSANKIRQSINKGELISFDFVNELARRKIVAEGEKGYIFEGYPRHIKNVVGTGLTSFTKINKVINLVMEDEDVMERLSGRRLCPDDKVYHLKYSPPPKGSVCDLNPHLLIQREDDTPRVIKRRLKYFYKYTLPVIKKYKKVGIVADVNGLQGIDDVHKSIMQKIE